MRTFALLLSLVAASAIKLDDNDKAWEKPIQKVMRLLNEMSEQLTKEADEDEDIMDKLGCWCHTNEQEKSKASAINSQRITDLGSAIEEFTAKSAQLTTDIETLNKEVADKTNSLDEQTQIREKDAAEFHATEKDTIQNMGSLKGALMTLGKVHGESLSQESLIAVKQVLRRQMKAHRSLLSAHQHRVVVSLLQTEPADESSALLLQAEGQAPQSGAIFGILKQMKESMETNQVQSQDDEAKAHSEFTDMSAARNQEIASAEELIGSKTQELAETGEKNAQSQQDLADTQNTLDADTEFLANLKSKCENADAEYAARSKIRNEEIQAVSDTIGILTDDDAKDLMAKTFFQVSQNSNNRAKAARFMQTAAKKLHMPKLSALAVSMRADVFAEVKKNIDTMVTGLKREQKDEVVQRDFCIKEAHQNEMQTAERTNQKEDFTTFIANFETSKAELAEEIKTLNAEVDQTHVEMKRASELRQKENADFQMTITDQQATQAILAKALDRLKAFYAKKALLQVRAHTAAKGDYKKSAGASGVMAMIDGVIQESKQEEKAALGAENDAQAAYEGYIADSNASLKAAGQSIVNKSENLARADEAKVKADGDLRVANEDLLKLAAYGMNLHTQCDFLTQHFDIRQQKRGEEIEALQQAKSIFSGADFGL